MFVQSNTAQMIKKRKGGNFMRKLLSVVLAGAMALSMTACSSKPAETTAAPAETSEAAAEAVTEAVSSEAKEGGYTIGFFALYFDKRILYGCFKRCSDSV